MSNTPIFDPDRGFRCWNITEIYTGSDGQGRYVPNVDDLVLDWTAGFYRVTCVNEVTGLSTLDAWDDPRDNTGVPEEDVLLGVDVAAQGESFRLYIDTSVTPHTLAIDSRLHVYGTTATFIKLFRGTDITDSGEVVSAMYDSTGIFVGENIPLELVAMPDQHNVAIKAPMVGYTLKNLQDGEVVTAVVYDDVSKVKSYSKLLVVNTRFIRTTDASRKFITGIHLESPFLSEEDERLLRFPINLPVADVPAIGVVTYSDGSQLRLPANSGKFRLYGMDHFVSSILGQKIPLVLTYHLNEDEVNYGATPGGEMHISENYWGVTTEFEKAFSIKLFAFPRWIDSVQGYTLEFFIYTLDRSFAYPVTSLVELATNSPSFQTHAYGLKQDLVYSIDMDQVDSRYPKYRHTQALSFTLKAPGDNSTFEKWLAFFSPTESYGDGLKADFTVIDANLCHLNLSNGFASKEIWLNNLYHATRPLINIHTEVTAPIPNVFRVRTPLRTYEFNVDQWNQDLQILHDNIYHGCNIYIEFINRSYENDLQLAIAGLAVNVI